MKIQRKPEWLKIKLPGSGHYAEVKQLITELRLNTVCQSAHCPNLGDCWARRTATFMIMGQVCSRNCRFCAVEHGPLLPLDAGEPLRVAQAVNRLGLRYVVVTSVTRDDLADGGAGHFHDTIAAIRRENAGCRIEVLIPDFKGSQTALQKVVDAYPDVLNHNVETVPRLYRTVRLQASYERSLAVLQYAAEAGMVTKSGLMLGLGETGEEILHCARELRQVGCRILTLGQYLPPSKDHVPVVRFIPPQEFDALRRQCLDLGFEHVESAPLVRSSYHADQQAAGRHTG